MLKWFSKYLRILKPESLRISIFDKSNSEISKLIDIFMGGAVESIEKLDLYCESEDMHLACSLCFPEVRELTIRSRCATNDLVGFMFENMKKINSLVVIKNDANFTAAKMSTYMKDRQI